MTWWLVLLGIVAPFGLATLTGAPYLPVLRQLREPLLDLAQLRPGQRLVDLGSGDGTLLRAAARRGVECTGYEINPVLWIVSRVVTWKYRHLVHVRLCNLWTTRLPPTDAVYVFLIDRHMARLDQKLRRELHRPTVVVSMTFRIPGRDPESALPYAFRYRYGDDTCSPGSPLTSAQ